MARTGQNRPNNFAIILENIQKDVAKCDDIFGQRLGLNFRRNRVIRIME